MKSLRIRLGVALVTAVSSIVTTVAVGVPAVQAATCDSTQYVDNKNTNLLVQVSYYGCSDGTWTIGNVTVSSIYDRYNAVLVIRRYQDDGSTVISWQESLGKLGKNVSYERSVYRSFNKSSNPYVYVRFRNSPTGAYVDSPIARLPWV